MANSAYLFLLTIALGISPAAYAFPPNPRDIAVTIHRDGEAIEVNVDLLVEATPREAWDVLTDYDHMTQYVSNIAMSRIISRAGDKLEVAQTSRLSFGLFELKIDNVRDIEFVPLQEIRSKIVRGDMKGSVFTTSLAADGKSTRITYQGRFIPGRWTPPLIGTAVLEAKTRTQFAELRAEISRRRALARLTHAVGGSFFEDRLRSRKEEISAQSQLDKVPRQRDRIAVLALRTKYLARSASCSVLSGDASVLTVRFSQA